MAKSLFSVVKNNLNVTGFFHLNEFVNEAGNKVLSLTREISGTPVTVHLEFDGDGVYINPARYTFVSRISHFDYTEEETRWTRRKSVMLGLVMKLQKAEVWPFISNKGFFKINENCRSLNKKRLRGRVQDEMDAALQPQKRAKIDREKIGALKKEADKLLKG